MNNKVHTDCIDNMRSIIEVPGDSGMPVVFPVHPGTQKLLQEYGLLERMPGNVSLIKPLGYLDMLMPVSYTHLRAHETKANLVCRLLLEKKKKKEKDINN